MNKLKLNSFSFVVVTFKLDLTRLYIPIIKLSEGLNICMYVCMLLALSIIDSYGRVVT
jgi:hypothetical protein